MDENTKKTQREIARDKIQVILSGIAVAVLVVMELYIMINFASNFMFMAVGILLMIVALFFLISAILDMSLKSKDMEQQKYEEIYNAQKASYLVIKKSFDEMDQRLRNIEENSSLPAEDIINAQKAVAKVTISRSKENTDALMNSNDELINQLFSIKEKLEANNNQIIEKQQAMLKETNFDIQQKISALTSQISIIEGKIQNGIPVMAQPVQMAAPVMPTPSVEPVSVETPVMESPAEEMPEMDTPVEDLGLDLDLPVSEEPLPEEDVLVEELIEESTDESPVEDLGIDLDMATDEEAVVEDSSEELVEGEEELISLEMPPEEPQEDIVLDETVAEAEGVTEEVAEEISLEPVAEEPISEEAVTEEASAEETLEVEEPPTEEIIEEAPVEEAPMDETPLEIPYDEPVAEEPQEEIVEETPVEEITAEEIPVEEATEEIIEETVEEAPVEEAPEEEIILESTPEEEEIIITDAPANDGVDLDALLEEVGGEVEEEPAPEPEPEPEPVEDKPEEIVIPDVGVDLTDPNRVMSPEEIEKLFANI